jgi:hypothetical protein
LLVAGVTGLFAIRAPASAAVTQDEVIPLVQLENVRLPDALRQMARKARLNVILDPQLSTPPFNEITISIRWENVTAREALMALLENHDLVLVEMPQRIFTEGN